MLSRQVPGTVEWYCYSNLVLMLTLSDALTVAGGPPPTATSIYLEAYHADF